MPRFTRDGQTFNNPVEYALKKIGGKWKMPILWRLREQKKRYGELKASLDGITHKMLSTQLKELERDGLLTRTVYEVVPPRVEYELTRFGKTSIVIIDSLRQWGLAAMKHDGIEHH
ncbi:MAG TPA: helix-turn-helix domain-containing protein [Turneriella sp.]|nr:helix-turn-helix domain-containing protein [Turneriella sp.]HNA80227.1 helix-turn-helix domain-containing protein [Turneriella sp.]HNE18388.1 helix-turn-helix domain-containing protein [Turneriella sp.]HNJ66540.1 helix-turn-helix domain-containing protein [Turneriella sp.]HNL10439.1 helix-turn-helix domain-containing protein [Turneriella sp.]